MRRPFARKLHIDSADPVAEAVARANKARRRGDVRAEACALRQACLIDEGNAALWTRWGDALVRLSKHDDALQAFRHALWLRERADDELRAEVTRRLLECVLRRMPAYAAA